MMDELYNKFYKMMYGEDAPYSDGKYTYYNTPQKYAMDLSENGKPLYLVPNDQVGLYGMFNRAFNPRAREYVDRLETNKRNYENMLRQKQGLPPLEKQADFNMMNTAYAGEREARGD